MRSNARQLLCATGPVQRGAVRAIGANITSDSAANQVGPTFLSMKVVFNGTKP